MMPEDQGEGNGPPQPPPKPPPVLHYFRQIQATREPPEAFGWMMLMGFLPCVLTSAAGLASLASNDARIFAIIGIGLIIATSVIAIIWRGGIFFVIGQFAGLLIGGFIGCGICAGHFNWPHS